MTVVWLPEAQDDLERLHDYLLEKAPAAAERAIMTVLAGADELFELPEIGYPLGDGTRRRELVVPFGAGAYILRYRAHRDTVVIIRVWHSREARE